MQAQKKRRTSPRGHWLVVLILKGEIHWVTWARTEAGVKQTKGRFEKELAAYRQFGAQGRVIVLDIIRMMDYAVTEGYNEILDLEALFDRS